MPRLTTTPDTGPFQIRTELDMLERVVRFLLVQRNRIDNAPVHLRAGRSSRAGVRPDTN